MFNLMADYKVIALPKLESGASRIFMLNKAAIEKHYFLEEYSRTNGGVTMLATYGKEKPDIRVLTRTVVSYLDNHD